MWWCKDLQAQGSRTACAVQKKLFSKVCISWNADPFLLCLDSLSTVMPFLTLLPLFLLFFFLSIVEPSLAPIHFEYYITRQLLPSLDRILAPVTPPVLHLTALLLVSP